MTFPSVTVLTSAPASVVAIERGIVDVWSCSLQASPDLLALCRGWLSEDERARAARFVRPEDQVHFALAHGGLRAVLARYLAVEPATLRFQLGPTGKPALLEQAHAGDDLHFNLCHSHGRMLVAVAHGRAVGIDLEQVRENVDVLKLAERFYTVAEYEWMKSHAPSKHALQFYRLWVGKEALLKGQGAGIPSLQQCGIDTSAVSSRADVRLIPDSTLQQGWTIQWLNCGDGWQGAVSAFGGDWSIRVLDGGTSEPIRTSAVRAF
jgi:4'-phosphopantetheinyl transferase